MLKSDVIKHFGSPAETAKALRISKSAVAQWKDIIPRGSAYTVQVITGGKLSVDPSLYPPKKKPASIVHNDSCATAA